MESLAPPMKWAEALPTSSPAEYDAAIAQIIAQINYLNAHVEMLKSRCYLEFTQNYSTNALEILRLAVKHNVTPSKLEALLTKPAEDEPDNDEMQSNSDESEVTVGGTRKNQRYIDFLKVLASDPTMAVKAKWIGKGKKLKTPMKTLFALYCDYLKPFCIQPPSTHAKFSDAIKSLLRRSKISVEGNDTLGYIIPIELLKQK